MPSSLGDYFYCGAQRTYREIHHMLQQRQSPDGQHLQNQWVYIEPAEEQKLPCPQEYINNTDSTLLSSVVSVFFQKVKGQPHTMYSGVLAILNAIIHEHEGGLWTYFTFGHDLYQNQLYCHGFSSNSVILVPSNGNRSSRMFFTEQEVLSEAPPLPSSNHVKRTHPSDPLGGVRPLCNRGDMWRGDMRRFARRHPRVRLGDSNERPPTTEHVLRGDGADHLVHVQHCVVSENRWATGDQNTRSCTFCMSYLQLNTESLGDTDRHWHHLSSRVCGWSRGADTGSPDGSSSLHHHLSYNTVHLCHFHQWCNTRRWSLLYPYPTNCLHVFPDLSHSYSQTLTQCDQTWSVALWARSLEEALVWCSSWPKCVQVESMFSVSWRPYLTYSVQILVSLSFLSLSRQPGHLSGLSPLCSLFPSLVESSVSVGIRVLPKGYWYTVLYSSVVLLLCLLVCLVGANIYCRTAFAILLVVTVSLLSIFISSVAVKPRDFVITHRGPGNQTLRYNASYTGYSATTLRSNLGCKC